MWILRFGGPSIAVGGHLTTIGACCQVFGSFAPPGAHGAWLLLVGLGAWIGFSCPLLPACAWLKWREGQRSSSVILAILSVLGLPVVSLAIGFVRTADTELWPCTARADLYGIMILLAGPLVSGLVSLFYAEALARPQKHTYDIKLENAPQSVAMDARPFPHLRHFDQQVALWCRRQRHVDLNRFDGKIAGVINQPINTLDFSSFPLQAQAPPLQAAKQ